MTAPNPPQQIVPLWQGRKGDGQTGYAVAVAAEAKDTPEAERQTHDLVVAMTGRLRAGPVVWVHFEREEGIEKMREIGMEISPTLQAWFEHWPDSLVVFAMAATDKP